jgi:hypothetical protein
MASLLDTWDDMAPLRRFVEAVFLPVLGGVGAGFAGSRSTSLYVVNILIAAISAVWLGSQHRDARGAQVRGLWDGALYAAMILVGLQLGGGESVAPWWIMPPSGVVLFLMIALPSVPLHRSGWAYRHGRVLEPAELG